MKGVLIVNDISSTDGVFISDLNYESAFVNKDNTTGCYRFVISSIKHEIFYIRLSDGKYRIYGEAWIVAGNPATIDKDVEALITVVKDEKVKYIDASNIKPEITSLFNEVADSATERDNR